MECYDSSSVGGGHHHVLYNGLTIKWYDLPSINVRMTYVDSYLDL